MDQFLSGTNDSYVNMINDSYVYIYISDETKKIGKKESSINSYIIIDNLCNIYSCI